MIYICILYLKSLETYLETLHSHFQSNYYFKMFKNSGSGSHWQISLLYTVNPVICIQTTKVSHIDLRVPNYKGLQVKWQRVLYVLDFQLAESSLMF
jgi:hypothetical protein